MRLSSIQTGVGLAMVKSVRKLGWACGGAIQEMP